MANHGENSFDAFKSGPQEWSFSITCECGWDASGTVQMGEADARTGRQEAAAYAVASDMLVDHIELATDPALAGFDPAALPEAALYRVAKIKGEDLPDPEREISTGHPECSYLLFADGSLYIRSNAEDEVWADAHDFVSDRLLPVRDQWQDADRELADACCMAD